MRRNTAPAATAVITNSGSYRWSKAQSHKEVDRLECGVDILIGRADGAVVGDVNIFKKDPGASMNAALQTKVTAREGMAS